LGLDIYFTKVKRKEIGYFRKVNFLVAFFEKKGFDVLNQTSLIIRRKDAQELLSKCEEVLLDHSKGPELLPTTSGFFFGSTDYDDSYYEDVESVRNYVKDKLLPEFDTLKLEEDILFETWY
jgi:hypothetical protein